MLKANFLEFPEIQVKFCCLGLIEFHADFFLFYCLHGIFFAVDEYNQRCLIFLTTCYFCYWDTESGMFYHNSVYRFSNLRIRFLHFAEVEVKFDRELHMGAPF